MIKNFILDTSVLVHDPLSIYNFQENNIIIPIVCIEELDNLKKKEGIVGYHARSAARELYKVKKMGNLHEGVKLPNGGTLKIELNHMDTSVLPDGMDLNKMTVDSCNHENLENEYKNMPTILSTKICICL